MAIIHSTVKDSKTSILEVIRLNGDLVAKRLIGHVLAIRFSGHSDIDKFHGNLKDSRYSSVYIVNRLICYCKHRQTIVIQ